MSVEQVAVSLLSAEPAELHSHYYWQQPLHFHSMHIVNIVRHHLGVRTDQCW